MQNYDIKPNYFERFSSDEKVINLLCRHLLDTNKESLKMLDEKIRSHSPLTEHDKRIMAAFEEFHSDYMDGFDKMLRVKELINGTVEFLSPIYDQGQIVVKVSDEGKKNAEMFNIKLKQTEIPLDVKPEVTTKPKDTKIDELIESLKTKPVAKPVKKKKIQEIPEGQSGLTQFKTFTLDDVSKE